jgi:hypothetical protein
MVEKIRTLRSRHDSKTSHGSLNKSLGKIMKPRKPIRKSTSKRSKELREYAKLRKAFLEYERALGDGWCICDKCQGPVPTGFEEVHHFYGKLLGLLCWMPGFRVVHRDCHRWIETHRKEAVKLGLRAPDTLFNRPSLVIPRCPPSTKK